MTEYAKIAVSLPARAAENVRRAVKAGRAASVSAYIADAIDQKAKTDSLRAMLDEWLAESGGPITPAERRAIRKALGKPTRRRKP